MVTLAYPPGDQGVVGLGVQVAGVYLGITLGPVLGGIITDNLGWRGLFFMVGAFSLLNLLVSSCGSLRGWNGAKRRPGSLGYRGFHRLGMCASALIIGFSYLPGVVGNAQLIAAGLTGLAVFVRLRGGRRILSLT